MPRTEQSAAWTTRTPAPESRLNFEAMEAAVLAEVYGPRCATLIPDILDLQRTPPGGAPGLPPMTFASV